MDKFKHLRNGIGEVRMSSSHALFVGHKPDAVKCADGLCENILSETTEEGLASFGLFGGSNDLNKFYPNLTAEDWTPKEADFIQPLFRALSETIVMQFGFIPIDFSRPGVLKAGVKKLLGQTVNTNHQTDVENAVGSVSKVSWQEATKVGGVTVPAGINAIFKIDAKSNPRLARNILMDPPAVHSDSVTVRFKHEPSHTFRDKEEFWRKLGTKNEDGELIRLIATTVLAFKEVSLVSHGADPFAQVMNKENINDPKYADSVYNFTDNNHKPHKKEDMELIALLASLGLQDSGIGTWDELVAHFNIEPEVAPEVALYQALVAVDETLTPESLTTLTENQLPEGATLLEEGQVILKEGETALTAEENLSWTELKELGTPAFIKDQVALGGTYLENIRDNAIRDYKLVSGEAADENILAVIKAADLKTAKSFEASYHTQLEKLVPLTCDKCGSDEVSRSSHKKEENSKADLSQDSYKESRDKHAAEHHRKPSDIHQKD